MTNNFKFLRDIKVKIDDIVIESRTAPIGKPQSPNNTLRMNFNCSSSANRHPNTCELKIYNLSREHRSQLQQGFNNTHKVSIEAGYVDARKEIYNGRSFQIKHGKHTVDWITELSCNEGVDVYDSRITLGHWDSGTPFMQIASDLCKQIPGLDSSQLVGKLNASGGLKIQGTFNKTIKGYAASGSVLEALFSLLSGAGYQIFVNNGRLEVVETGGTIGLDIPINVETGLIGTPEVGLGGRITVKCLLDGRLTPGRGVILTSLNIKGQKFRILEVAHDGDNFATNWYTTMVVTAT